MLWRTSELSLIKELHFSFEHFGSAHFNLSEFIFTRLNPTFWANCSYLSFCVHYSLIFLSYFIHEPWNIILSLLLCNCLSLLPFLLISNTVIICMALLNIYIFILPLLLSLNNWLTTIPLLFCNLLFKNLYLFSKFRNSQTHILTIFFAHLKLHLLRFVLLVQELVPLPNHQAVHLLFNIFLVEFLLFLLHIWGFFRVHFRRFQDVYFFLHLGIFRVQLIGYGLMGKNYGLDKVIIETYILIQSSVSPGLWNFRFY